MINLDIFYYIIPIGSLAILAFLCAALSEKGSYSTNAFLACFAIGIGVLVWIPILPSYTIVISALMIIGMLLSGGENE